MKEVENFKINSSKINGNMTLFTDNFNKTKGRVGTFGVSAINSFKQFVNKFGTVKIFNRPMTVKVCALFLAGTLSITSLTGCSSDKTKSNDNANETTIAMTDESTELVKYKVKYGDTLWDIASKYRFDDAQIAAEVMNIQKNNNLGKNDILKEGTVLKLYVPKDKLSAFGVVKETKRIEYEVKLGDSIWSIAGMYYEDDGDIANEVRKIQKDNNIGAHDILRDGTILKLNVPYNKLSVFGIEVDKSEIPGYDDTFDIFKDDSSYKHYEETWKNRLDYITDKWQNAKDDVSPENLMFQRDYERIFGYSDGTGGLLLSVYSKIYDLKEIVNDPYGLYNDDDISKKVSQINDLIAQIDEITEINFYGSYQSINESKKK